MSENADELWFLLGDNKVAQFSLMEFLIVICLNADNEAEVWAYEAIPGLADKWAIRKEWTKISRMLNWQATDISTTKVIAAILDDPQIENEYNQGLYIPARVPHHISDTSLVGKEGHSPTVQWSSTPHRPSPSLPPTHCRRTSPRMSRTPSPVIRQSSIAHAGSNEVVMEMDTRDQPNVEMGIWMDMETEVVTGQSDVEIDGVTDRDSVVKTDGVTDGMVTAMETSGQE
ncbi:hypothetical protein Adt_40721 [Abeliophyllum distichum]|uniref:Uncharacterized protein n=1 Tax=Abeliophyllum distichum TaxID=126358 RepID=A0ABD1PLU0_9LAMI